MIQRTGKSDTAVVGWGRGMGHKGHMLLARAVIVQAQNMGADPYFFVSRTVGADDPLYPEEKLYIYKKVFPKQANIFQSATDDIPDINRLMRTLAELGYKNAVLVVGADQVKAFQYLVGQDKAGNIVYKTLGLENLSVIKRQDVDDAAQSEEGPRATPMREILKDPNASDEQKFAVWRDAMPDALSDKEVLALMQKASQRMGEFKPAAKKTKVKEFIQRVRPMLKEASVGQKVKILKLLKESLHSITEGENDNKDIVRLPPEMTGRDPSKPYVDIGPYTISMRGDDATTQQDARHLGTILSSVPNPLTKAAGMAMRYAGQYDKLPTGEKVARAIDSAGTPDEISRYLKKKAVKEQGKKMNPLTKKVEPEDSDDEELYQQGLERNRFPHYHKHRDEVFSVPQDDGSRRKYYPGTWQWEKTYKDEFDLPSPKDPIYHSDDDNPLVEIDEPFNLEKRHSMDYGMRKTMIHRLAKATDYDVSDLSLASDEELSDLYKEVFPDDSINEDYLDEK